MLQFLLANKWIILLTCEITAWIFTFLMFYARYWQQSNRLFLIYTVVAVTTGWIPNLTLSGLNIIKTQTVGFFEIFAALLLLYGWTWGKKHFQWLDQRAKEWIDKKRNLALSEGSFSQKDFLSNR